MKRVSIIGFPEWNPAVKGGTINASLNVVLYDEAPSADVTVSFSGSRTTNSGNLTFTTANWQTPQSITFSIASDSIKEGHVYDDISISATGGGYDFSDSFKLITTDALQATNTLLSGYFFLTWYPIFRSKLFNGASKESLRSDLITNVYSSGDLPSSSTPDAITSGYSGVMHELNTADLTGYTAIDQLSFIQDDRLSFEWTSLLYHIKTSGSTKCVFVNAGHGSDDGYTLLIQSLIDAGVDVVYGSMPVCDQNTTTNPSITLTGTDGHNQIKSSGLDDGSWQPMLLFVEDRIKCLNYLQANYSYSSFYSAGLSGGGLVSMIHGALDSRINKTFVVRALIPMQFKFNAFGDYEQGGNLNWRNFATQVGNATDTINGFYTVATYFDQLLMVNGTCYHHYNYYDGIVASTLFKFSESVMSGLGNYVLSYDDDAANSDHAWSATDVAVVVNNL